MSDEQDKLKLSLEPPKLFGRKKKSDATGTAKRTSPASATPPRPAPADEESDAEPIEEPNEEPPEELVEEPVTQELATPEPEPVADATPEPATEPVADVAPEGEPEPVADVTPEPEPDPAPKKSAAPAVKATAPKPAAKKPATKTPATKTPATKTPATKTPATKTPAAKSPAAKTPAEKTPAEKTPAAKTPAEKTPAAKTPAEKTTAAKAGTAARAAATRAGDAAKKAVRPRAKLAPDIEPEPLSRIDLEDAEIVAQADEPPLLPPYPAAAVTGAAVGATMIALIMLSLRGCDAVKGTATCSGGPGFVLLVATFVACVLLGSALLKVFSIPDPGSSSFLGVGLVAVVALLFLIEALEHWSMLIVIPIISVGAFLASVWVTKTFVEPGAPESDASP